MKSLFVILSSLLWVSASFAAPRSFFDEVALLETQGEVVDRPHWAGIREKLPLILEGHDETIDISPHVEHLLGTRPVTHTSLRLLELLIENRKLQEPSELPRTQFPLSRLIQNLAFLSPEEDRYEQDVIEGLNAIGVQLKASRPLDEEITPLRETYRKALPVLLSRPLEEVEEALEGALANPMYEIWIMNNSSFSVELVDAIHEAYGDESAPLFLDYLAIFHSDLLEKVFVAGDTGITLRADYLLRNRAIIEHLREALPNQHLEERLRVLLAEWKKALELYPVRSAEEVEADLRAASKAVEGASPGEPSGRQKWDDLRRLIEEKLRLWGREQLDGSIAALEQALK